MSTSAPAWALALRRINQYLMFDLLGGPKPWRLAWIINLQKGGSFPFFALLMYLFPQSQDNLVAWVYLALHGSYGLTWLIKDILYPDPNWQGHATIASGLFGALGLAGYWLAGMLIITGIHQPQYPLSNGLWLLLCITLCVMGMVIMIIADVHKYTQLKVQRGLIEDGIFKYVRHPNYLGEMMIYGALALLAWHWAPLLVLLYYWLTMFSVNMVMKEASMSRYPAWAAYKKRSWWLLPLVF
jgi:protein-S-isoprenylcysteine O-methyltransferase Ste14